MGFSVFPSLATKRGDPIPKGPCQLASIFGCFDCYLLQQTTIKPLESIGMEGMDGGIFRHHHAGSFSYQTYGLDDDEIDDDVPSKTAAICLPEVGLSGTHGEPTTGRQTRRTAHARPRARQGPPVFTRSSSPCPRPTS